MYADDHNPPHFHLIGPGWRASYVVKGRKRLKGKVPANAAKAAKQALSWAAMHEMELLARWAELNEREK